MTKTPSFFVAVGAAVGVLAAKLESFALQVDAAVAAVELLVAAL